MLASAGRRMTNSPRKVLEHLASDRKNDMQTSYYQSKKLNPKKHLVIQTSNGAPRFGAQPEWESEHLMPPSDLVARAKQGKVNEFQFYKEYTAHLEKIGVDIHRVFESARIPINSYFKSVAHEITPR
jgi:hypothetical protein